jgi:hypothetical protein
MVVVPTQHTCFLRSLLLFTTVAGLGGDDHLLAVHLVLGEVLDLHRAEGAQAHVQRDLREVDALQLHALHQLAAEVQAAVGAATRPSCLA